MDRPTSRPTRRATGTGSSAWPRHRDAGHGGRRRSPASPGLRAQAQLVRPRGRPRARRRDPAAALRAPRGQGPGDHRRARSRVLLGRQHLHARAVEPLVQGQLLQVHQRDPALPRGRVGELGAGVSVRVQGNHRRRRLRARAGVRRGGPGRRRQLGGVVPRDPAARRPARHRRADPPRRQAQGPPRPRRRVLHHRRGHQGQARQGLGPGRRRRVAQQVGRGRRRPRPRARRQADRDARPGGHALRARAQGHRQGDHVSPRRAGNRPRRAHRGARPQGLRHAPAADRAAARAATCGLRVPRARRRARSAAPTCPTSASPCARPAIAAS